VCNVLLLEMHGGPLFQPHCEAEKHTSAAHLRYNSAAGRGRGGCTAERREACAGRPPEPRAAHPRSHIV